MRKISRIIGTILCIIFIPILIINMVLIIKTYINPQKAPDFLGYKPFIVLSGSMEPEILIGDIAIIKECEPEQLKERDIIAFRSGNSVITHRIIDITYQDNEKVFITKGDNNDIEDRYPVELEDVEGVFVARIPKLGNFAMFLQTTEGTVIFISIPFIIFMVHDIMQRKKEAEIQKKKQEELEKELKKLREKEEVHTK